MVDLEDEITNVILIYVKNTRWQTITITIDLLPTSSEPDIHRACLIRSVILLTRIHN